MKTNASLSIILLIAFATLAVAPAPPSRVEQRESPLTINARLLRGTESLLVQGTAPAGASVLLSLSATFDRDVPAVVIDRLLVVADADNTFTAVIPYTSASERFVVLAVQASLHGLSPVVACCFSVRGPSTSSSPSPN